MGTGELIRGASTASGLGRVLLASGDAGGASVVERCLASAGFETDVCESRQVLVVFQRTLPDLVVISAGVAPSHTLAVSSWIRSRGSTPLIVIASSATLDPVDVLARGADLVLPTSVGESELVARVRGLLRHSPPRRAVLQPVLSVGDVTLDREAGQLRLSGHLLQLEGRELHLMEMLILGGSKLTTRPSLRIALDESDGGLDRLVRRLRERLESVEGWRRIVAVRGVGFRLLDGPPAGTDATGRGPVIDLRPMDAGGSSQSIETPRGASVDARSTAAG